MGFFDVFKRNGKAETPKENYTDYSRYLQYTYNPWKPGADKRTVVNMRYAGWKMLLGEALSEDIERELGLRYSGNGIWADDYVNHCRKVLTLFKINDAFVTFQWGLNFDFVPVIKSKGKAGYARTDKSIKCHIFEVPTDFYKCTENRDQTILDGCYFELDYFNESVSRKIITYKESFAYVLPDIKAFYKRTSDYDGILQFIAGQKENGYYCFMNWNGLVLSGIFIEHYLSDAEASLKHFSELRIKDAVLQEALHRKLLEAPVQQAPDWLPGNP